MRVINHTKLIKDYQGKWVVLDKKYQSVLAFGNTLKAAVNKYRRQGHTGTPSVLKVPIEKEIVG
jgi:hypothetical protein